MKFHFSTHRKFLRARIVVEDKVAILSFYSYKLNNLGKKRWHLKYKGKDYYKNNNELQRMLKDSLPYNQPIISVKNKKGLNFKAKINNMIYNTSSNLKNNLDKKYFLVFYIDLPKKHFKLKKAFELRNIEVDIKSKVLSGPRFQYGYCDDFMYRPCSIKDYLDGKMYMEGILTGPSLCMPFDHEKGPFNMYCAGNT